MRDAANGSEWHEENENVPIAGDLVALHNVHSPWGEHLREPVVFFDSQPITEIKHDDQASPQDVAQLYTGVLETTRPSPTSRRVLREAFIIRHYDSTLTVTYWRDNKMRHCCGAWCNQSGSEMRRMLLPSNLSLISFLYYITSPYLSYYKKTGMYNTHFRSVESNKNTKCLSVVGLRSNVRLVSANLLPMPYGNVFCHFYFANEEELTFQQVSSLRFAGLVKIRVYEKYHSAPCFTVITTNYDSISDKFIARINCETYAPKHEWRH